MPGNNRPLEIMLVEDDAALRMYIEEDCRHIGINNNIHSYANISDALGFLNGAKAGGVQIPDILLLDVNLGNENGFDLLRLIKSEPAWKKIQVIVMTGHDSTNALARAAIENAEYYLPKPISAHSIHDAVVYLISKKKAKFSWEYQERESA